ncbi:MAG: hypothetical protein V1745_01300 [Patescibacteria group bacterium]
MQLVKRKWLWVIAVLIWTGTMLVYATIILGNATVPIGVEQPDGKSEVCRGMKHDYYCSMSEKVLWSPVWFVWIAFASFYSVPMLLQGHITLDRIGKTILVAPYIAIPLYYAVMYGFVAGIDAVRGRHKGS